MTSIDTTASFVRTRRTRERGEAAPSPPCPSKTRAPAASAAPRSTEPHRDQKRIGTFHIPAALLDDIPEEHRRDIFILILDGDCLEPEVHHNDCAIVAPGMPVRPGDFAVLWPKNPAHRPQMKRVVMAPLDGWEKFDPATWEVAPLVFVEQINPPRQYQISTDKLAAIHRVVATFQPGDYERVAMEPPAPKRQGRAAGGRR